MNLFRRIVSSLGMLLAITMLSFLLMQWAPGDPAAMMIDPSMSEADIERIHQNLGLDAPVILQYGRWLFRILQGDFGTSFQTGQPVLSTILERLPATLLLSVSSLLLIVAISIVLGVLSAENHNGFFDIMVTIASFVGMAIPAFWLGLMLILFGSITLGVFPTSGFMNPMMAGEPLWRQAINIMLHMCLPLATIVIGGVAGLIRYNRFSVLDILNQDYIKAATSRGLSRRLILFKHVFKNASLPLITILGLSLPGLIGGSFVIEYVFAWPGMGQLGLGAVFARDYPMLMGTLLLSSVLIIIGNALADWAYAQVDPRIVR